MAFLSSVQQSNGYWGNRDLWRLHQELTLHWSFEQKGKAPRIIMGRWDLWITNRELPEKMQITVNPNSKYKWQQGNWPFYNMVGHWAAPKTVLLWRQREGLKFCYSSRKTAVNRRMFPWSDTPCISPTSCLVSLRWPPAERSTIYFVSISILTTNSKSQPPEQRQTHFQPTDLKTSAFEKWLDMSFMVQVPLLNNGSRGLSSPNSTDIIKFQASVQYISDILWPCHWIEVTKRI